MADDETQNAIVTHILTLKDQVLKWAAPKKHDDTSGNYGKATNTNFGHVKLNDTITTDSNKGDNPVKTSAIIQYVSDKITEAKNEVQSKLNIQTEIGNNPSNKTDDKFNIPTTKAVADKLANFQPIFNVIESITKDTKHKTNNQYNIPTGEAVWSALSSYKDLLVGVDYKTPQSYKGGIGGLITAGYYIMDHSKSSPKTFSYGGENIYYTNALVVVKKQSNRVIQYVCATSKITSSSNPNQYNYKINGSEYTRYGSYNSAGEVTWKPWHLTHKPYSKTARAVNLGRNVDDNSVVVYENTAGFIIQWKQTRANKQYNVYKELYEYADVCEFSPALPINGPYVFGNLIGRMDIRITSNKMQIRSNVAPGGRIIGMEETYFVPRNQ